MGDKQLLQALPAKLRSEVERICAATGKKPVALVREIVATYKARGKQEGANIDLTSLSKEFKEAVLKVAGSIQGKQGNAGMTPEQKTARAQAGAARRNEKLTPEERKKIAQDAAKARWEKQTKPE